jgi:predicted MFS family arabinose efflux permease
VALLGVVAAWSLVGWWFNPAQQQRLLDIAGPRGTIGVSLNGSALYAGQALGGLVGGAALASGPAALALVAVGFELLALAVLALSSPILRFGMECHGQAVHE